MMRFNSLAGTLKNFGLAAAVGLLTAGTAMAQSATAAIQGQAAPGDVAIIANIDSGFTREVKANSKGRYQLRNLPTGTFSVTVKHPDGSLEKTRVVTLRVGTTARVQ
jgi:Carboxypeptidase regulatory-like domain